MPRNQLSGLGKSKFYRGSISTENEAIEEAINAESDEKFSVDAVFSENMIRFCEAVVHPFGNEAIGALLPDHYQELVIPVTDRLELDLTPDLFNLAGSWEATGDFQLDGVFLWIMPRCTAAGTVVNFIDDGGSLCPRNPYLGVNADLSALEQSIPLEQYSLCFTGIWSQTGTTSNAPITYGFFSDAGVFGNAVIPIYYSIQYTRFDNINRNCDKLRLLGAGLKVWSEQAPINTGGYSVGGWITIEDIMQATSWTNRASPLFSPGPATPGALKAIQPKIKFACRTPGVKGSTVRYSPLQTSDQVEAEYPKIPSRMFTTGANTVTPLTGIVPNIIVDQPNADLAINDVITPGSFVPCIFWQFNTTDNSGVNVNGVYTLKVMSMIHGEGTPTGESPFMACKSATDPSAAYAKAMVENLEVFPPAVTGHSFKSFISKMKHVVAKAKKVSGHVTKVLALADKFAETFG
jgi:hypothetical protein